MMRKLSDMGVTIDVPVSGRVFAQEGPKRTAEIGELFVASVLGDVFMRQSPQSFNRIKMGTVGRNEVKFDPALRP
jgi:hypothetical protein